MGRKLDSRIRCEQVHEHMPDIVARIRVLGTWVTQAHNHPGIR